MYRHQIRNSTKYVNYKDYRQFCKGMKEICQALTEEAGLMALDRFEEKWSVKYAYAIKSWRLNWSCLATFFKYSSEIERLIYTTNLIESFNSTLRRITRMKSSFPTDDSLFKIFYLAIMDTSKE